MRKIIYYICLCTLAVMLFSCDKDNYDAPDARISGKIIDHNGKQVQTEQGSGNMRIKMEELSWGNGSDDISITPTYLNVKQDGTYINTKIFSGEYRLTPIEGPFYPISEEDASLVKIKGNVNHDFTIIPYLELEWVGEPVVTNDNYIEASVRFKRNAKVGEVMPDLLNGQLFIATTQYAGNNNYDSQLVGGVKTIVNSDEGSTITFKTTRAVKYTGTSYYVRVGICCSDSYKKYNYTDIIKVDVK